MNDLIERLAVVRDKFGMSHDDAATLTEAAAKAPFLPYDYARCHGRDWPECADCLRMLAPGRPGGWQTYLLPRETRPHPAWRCDYRIGLGEYGRG